MKQHIGSGCGVLIIKDGMLLLGRRSDDKETADSEMHEEGTWTCPGGNINYGETFEEAGRREVLEETGMVAKDLEVICVQTDLNEHAHYVSVGMIAHSFEGEASVMEPEQIVQWKWFDFDDLPSNIFTPSKKTIDCYLNKKFYMG